MLLKVDSTIYSRIPIYAIKTELAKRIALVSSYGLPTVLVLVEVPFHRAYLLKVRIPHEMLGLCTTSMTNTDRGLGASHVHHCSLLGWAGRHTPFSTLAAFTQRRQGVLLMTCAILLKNSFMLVAAKVRPTTSSFASFHHNRVRRMQEKT